MAMDTTRSLTHGPGSGTGPCQHGLRGQLRRHAHDEAAVMKASSSGPLPSDTHVSEAGVIRADASLGAARAEGGRRLGRGDGNAG